MNGGANSTNTPGARDIFRAAHLFRPERLTLARELRGLTKTDLAERIQKTPAAVSQFEAGRARPEPGTLGALALALQVPAGFFARADGREPVPTEAAYFRSLRSTSQARRRQLLSRAVLVCELVDLLEAEVDLPAANVPQVETPPGSPDEIEGVAESVRAAWGLGLGPIPNLVALLESKGILVLRLSDEQKNVDAFSLRSGQRPLIFLIVAKDSTSRARMDGAHELAHLVMHHDVVPGSAAMEREANRFASAFLFPRESFLREGPRSLNWGLIFELKRRWGVSAHAIVRRAFDLGMIGEATYRRGFIHLGRNRQREREECEPPVELPMLLREALELVAADFPAHVLAAELGVHSLGDVLCSETPVTSTPQADEEEPEP
jgi:Zn-dependent peptidase ImmA (M78 family)/transcriptional regulator with XRE-family HTH domain